MAPYVDSHANDTMPAATARSDLNIKAPMDSLLIPNEVVEIIFFINYSILCTAIGLFGFMTNVLNVMVFVRQGFHDTVNLSLFTLALADMAGLLCLAFVGTCFNPYLDRLQLPFAPREILVLVGGLPKLLFTRVGGWVTSVVAVERCVCVMRPLQVKLIFTRQRLIGAQVLILLAATGTVIPPYCSTYLTWKVDSASNRSYLGSLSISNRHEIDRITYVFGVSASLSAFVTVTSCTFILGWNLVKQSRWRAQTMVDSAGSVEEPKGQEGKSFSDNNKKKKTKVEMSTRDRQAVRTVTFIAAMFVVCLTPSTLNLAMMSIFPEYNRGAKYGNVVFIVWSFAQMFEGICSSANIFVYYQTSTRFRDTLKIILQINQKQAAN